MPVAASSAVVAAWVTAAVVDEWASVAWAAAGAAAANPAATARVSTALAVRRGEPASAPRTALYEDDRMGRAS
ncbi:hypothetical protein GCM10010524_07890 [Streptomyces mexicanus]